MRDFEGDESGEGKGYGLGAGRGGCQPIPEYVKYIADLRIGKERTVEQHAGYGRFA